MLKFPHFSEQILQKLDSESIFRVREVARSWKNIIDGRNYPWLRTVNIPTILKERNSYLHLASATGQIEAFKTAINQEDDVNIKNEKPLNDICNAVITLMLAKGKPLYFCCTCKKNSKTLI